MALTPAPKIDFHGIADCLLPNVSEFLADPIFEPVNTKVPHGFPRLVYQRQIGWEITINGAIEGLSEEEGADLVEAAYAKKAEIIQALAGQAVSGLFDTYQFAERFYTACFASGKAQFSPVKWGVVPVIEFSLSITSNDPGLYIPEEGAEPDVAVTNLTTYPFAFAGETEGTTRTVTHVNRSGRDLMVKQVEVAGHDSSMTGSGSSTITVSNGSSSIALVLAFGSASGEQEGEVTWANGASITITATSTAKHVNLQGQVLCEG